MVLGPVPKFILGSSVSSSVTKETIKTPKWKCDGPSEAMVYSPKESGKFPVISFAHGWTAGGNKVDADYGPKLLEPLAAAGYVVIATMDAPSNYCEYETEDQITSLGLALSHPKADSSQPTGIAGHSMGGHATVYSSGNSHAVQKYNIAAAVALHPAFFPFVQPTVPIFYATGSADTIVKPSGVKGIYEITKGSKVFAEIKGATHLEPNTLGGRNRWTPYVINMFNCWIKEQDYDCDKIYGNKSGDLCNNPNVPMSDCHNSHKFGAE
jgi:dienelactone hydrolase